MKIFHRLFLSHLIIALVAVIVASGFTGYRILSQTRIWMMEQLMAYGRETAALLKDRDWNSQEMRDLQTTFNNLERRQETNVWLVDREGLIRLSSAAAERSEHGPSRLPVEAWNQLLEGEPTSIDRPGRPGRGFPPAVAVPVLKDGKVAGAVVLSPVMAGGRWRGLTPWAFLLYGGLLAALVVGPVSYAAARRIARPISMVGAAGRRVARGDFTARVDWRSPDEVGDLASGFNEMAAELGRLEAARKELMAHVSHELKGPLARISGYMEAIHDGIGGEAARAEHFAIVRQEVGRLTRLINDLLDVSRLEAGRLKLHPIPCDLGPYLNRAVAVFEGPAQASQVRLIHEIPANLPIVLCEPERVEQVMVNLLQNALAHTPAGGTIRVSTRVDQRWLSVSVADTGSGIPPEELGQIWERFHKIDRARTLDKSGSGLGLTIVRQLTELQGGEVWVESTVGQGSLFGYRLPLAIPET